jgi:adenylylsulfate kinase-like enzyme
MSWAAWITGLSGTGKSAIARALFDRLAAAGHHAELLELDEMRRVVTPEPTNTELERNLLYRALVYVASTLVDSGVPVIIDGTAHRRAWRDLARARLPRFVEIEVTCQLEACRERAMAYESASAPELRIDTSRETPDKAGARIAELVKAWPQMSSRSAPPEWTIWLTGLPGSGKTTLAGSVADALMRRRVDVRILDLAEVRAFVTAGLWSPLGEDLAHRALVYAAKRLSESGTPVILDATAPARAWRQLARQTIPRFAEVQLICPASVCGSRERAVRWRLLGCPHRRSPAPATDGPDVVLDYEHALAPELTIHTDVEDPWSAVQAVLALSLRLQNRESPQVA